MKKSFLLFAFMLALPGLPLAFADGIIAAHPTSEGYPLGTSDFAGVLYTTISFSSANAVCFTGQGSIVGFMASSSTISSDFIMFSDSAPTDKASYISSGAVSAGQNAGDDYTTTNEVFRVYMATTTPTPYGETQLGTYFKCPVAVRFKGGALAKMTTNAYNKVVVLWTRLSKTN